MWEKIADFSLHYRRWVIVGLVAITGFMASQLGKLEMSYDFSKTVPPSDPEMVFYQQFLRQYGEDGNLFVIGLRDSAVYRYEVFQKFSALAKQIAQIEGVNEVLSIPTIRALAKDDSAKRFGFLPVFEPEPRNQAELDSLLREVQTIKLYENQIVNPQNGATMIVVAIHKEVVKTPARATLVFQLIDMGEAFGQATGIDMHYSGVPYVRTVVARNVRQELNIFLGLSLAVTVVVMYLFFRALAPVLVSLALIAMVVVWTTGTMGLLGYKITILTGLLPPILVVIGIPNCIYWVTKYHQEFLHHGERLLALRTVVRKIGAVTLMTNLTTAIGFAVLLSVDISILREFGLVAGINIVNTFLISLLFLPALFSFLPDPSARHTRHLDRKRTRGVLLHLVQLSANHRPAVYLVSLALVVVSLVGLWRIKAVSYMVDDLPQDSPVIRDLRFFEANFKGVMPLEMVVDTGKKRVLRDLKRLRKIDELENYLRGLDHVSPPVSALSFVKAANQALGTVRVAETYSLPSQTGELVAIERYTRQQQEGNADLMRSFVDSTGQSLRITLKVADLGSIQMDTLVQGQIIPKANEILAGTGMTARLTGGTLLFIKGNSFLIQNMQQSLALAIVLIGTIIGSLFRNVRIMFITVVSNLLPILITAGLMGFFGVPLKPSTALIFSIVFGIAVDDAIHFLARYRQELKHHNFNVEVAVRISIMETGISMIYTSVVLFAGFIIFIGSEFGGTVALGALTSSTLVVAMLINLILLPCLLYTFSKGRADTATEDDLIADDEDDASPDEPTPAPEATEKAER
jgi:predicted RND superfamily exporter protein